MPDHYETKFEIEARERNRYRADGWLQEDYRLRHRSLDILESCADKIAGGHFLEALTLYGRFAEWEQRRLKQKEWNMRSSLESADYVRLALPCYRDPADRERGEIERIWAGLERQHETLTAQMAACPPGEMPDTVQVDSAFRNRVTWFKHLCALFYEPKAAQE